MRWPLLLFLALAAGAFAQTTCVGCAGSGGGSATPGGASGAVQFNNAGALGGAPMNCTSAQCGIGSVTTVAGLDNPVATPTPSLVASTGNVDAGSHRYCVAFTNAATPDGVTQTTQCGPWSSPVTADVAHGQVNVVVPIGPEGTTGRLLYRTCANCDVIENNALDNAEYVDPIPDNTTTVYVDNYSDDYIGGPCGSGGACISRLNTTSVIMSGSQIIATPTPYGLGIGAPSPYHRWITILKPDGTFGTLYAEVSTSSSLTSPHPYLPRITDNTIAMGSNAGFQSLYGGIFIGDSSGYNVTEGYDNTFVGKSAGQSVTTGAENVGIGIGTFSTANFSPTTGSDNTGIGSYNCGDITSGSNNTCLGARTGDSAAQSAYPITGSGNVLLGAHTGFSVGDNSNTIAIGYQTTVGASGSVAIGNGVANATANSVNIGTNSYVMDRMGASDLFSDIGNCTSEHEGSKRPVSDSTTNTWGATVTGGGSNHVLAYCDATNWTVIGK